MKYLLQKGVIVGSLFIALNAFADNASQANNDMHHQHHHQANTTVNDKQAVNTHLCDHKMDKQAAEKHAKDHNGSHSAAHLCDHNNDLYAAEGHMVHH
ncbi:hypothetical protein [Legionella sp. W05-934-2]|jgi:hypothetical protein|uniref:hypothetical protein n=1 Tax=Legionella sp. W05-934-2 TaxID=1198649 RepID=UPI003463792A